MGLFDSQVKTRMQLDAKGLEDAYATLAGSVYGASGVRAQLTLEDLALTDNVVAACLASLGIEAAHVPDDIVDFEARVRHACAPAAVLWRKVHLEEGWHKKGIGSMVGFHGEDREPVALIPHGTRYRIFDTVTHTYAKVTDELADELAPDAYVFYRPLPLRSLTLRDLISFMWSVFDRFDYLFVIFSTLAVTLVGMLPAYANSVLFSHVIPSYNASLIGPVAALLFGVTISCALASVYQQLVMGRIAPKLEVACEAATMGRLFLLPTSFFKDYSAGELASRVSQISVLCQLMMQMLLGSGLTAVFSLLYLFQVWAYARTLLVPALVVVLVQAGLLIATTIGNARLDRVAMEANVRLSGTVTSLLGAIPKIKLAGAEDRAFAKWARGYAPYATAQYQRSNILRALPGISAGVGVIGTAVIFWFAAADHVTMSDFMSFNVSFGQITGAISMLTSMAAQIALIRPMLDLVKPILSAVPEADVAKKPVERITGAITLSHVTFGYVENQSVINDLSLSIRPGEYVAIVGQSGCGKSTLVRLLLGFEQPEIGAVYYDAHDVASSDLRSIRSLIGTVLQDAKLFLGTIESNITISTPGATLEDAWRAAEIAGVAADIRAMPMGMQSLVTEGSGGISGGQRQRILIARAVCGHRRVLIFDEATSALDNVTQRHVADSLARLKCTRIVIAHRLSTVRHCDRILMLDEGRIVEEGTYDELMARRGRFYDLVRRQQVDT